MADDADLSVQKEELILDGTIRCVLEAAAKMPKGEPGICYYCGEESQRLVGIRAPACARCRDKRHLP